MKAFKAPIDFVLPALLVLGAMLRTLQAGAFDVYRDAALNSFRALGWFDYLVGAERFQTGPFQWFETLPWWASLSFHDAPPLVFFIQNVFFAVFGDSAFALRLPFILAGIALIYMVYRLLLASKGKAGALIGAAVFAVSSYAVWTALSANLEGIQYVLVVLSFAAFLTYFKEGKQRAFLLGAFWFALALLAKYTTLFFALVPLGYVLIYRRELLATPSFWKQTGLAVVIVLAVLSPVLTYNAFVYQTRGHFDAALSSIVGMQPEDYAGIAGRAAAIGTDGVVDNVANFGRVMLENSSLPLVGLFVLCVLFLLYRVLRREADELERLTLLTLGALVLMFAFLPSESRFLSLILPFLALAVGSAAAVCMQGKWRGATLLVIFLILVAEFAYSVNTNVLAKPLGEPGTTYSARRLYAFGFNELEAHLRAHEYETLPARYTLHSREDLVVTPKHFAGQPVVVYDDSINWFAWYWGLLRLQTYYKLPLVPLEVVLSLASHTSTYLETLSEASKRDDVYFVKAVASEVIDPLADENPARQEYLRALSKRLDEAQVPYEEVVNQAGVVAFRIFHIQSATTSYLHLLNP